MMELDKKIREGLARQAAAPMASHPDPDLLTAFVEQALSQPERQQVLQHLSLCTDCREVVALSLPELDAAPIAIAQPETSIWRRWLVVRWTAAAAAVVVVAGAVTLYQTNQPHQMAKIVDGKDYIASQEAKARQAQTPAQASKSEARATQEQAIPSAANVANKKPSEEIKPAEPVMMANAGLADRLAAVSKDEAGAKKEKTVIPPSRPDEPMMAKAAPAPVAPPPVSAATASRMPTISSPAEVAKLDRPIPVQGSTYAGLGSNSIFPSGNGQPLRQSGDQPVQTYDQGDNTFTVADAAKRRSGFSFDRADAGAAKTLESHRPMSVGMFGTTAPIPNAPMLNHGWTVTNNGLLQRSHGGSDTHTVRVADGVFFKAVAQTASEVWAGGIGGALYHSLDDGRSWMKVMPSAGDQPLIADITSIHATQRGTAELGTSNNERWITVDGGQHWTRHQ